MMLKEEVSKKVIAEWSEKFRSKESPPMTQAQLEQFRWIINRVWLEAIETLCPEVRKAK